MLPIPGAIHTRAVPIPVHVLGEKMLTNRIQIDQGIHLDTELVHKQRTMPLEIPNALPNLFVAQDVLQFLECTG